MPDFAVSTGFTATDRISSAFRAMGRGASIFENKATKSFRNVGRAGSRTGDIMKGILGADIIRRGVRLLTQGLRTATTEFIAFDQAVTSASSKFKDLNLSTEEGQRTLQALKDTAREVGATTQFTAGQAAQGLDFLAMAGFNAEQAIATLAPTVDLATVGQIDLSRATDIASDSLGAFGLMTQDTNKLQANFTRLNDVMALTMSRTNTNMEDMFEAIKKGAPTFTAAGQSLETFNALLGTMANSGVKGSEAGTALRNVMLRLSNPVKEAQTVLDGLSIKTQDMDGNFRDVIDILKDFETGLVGMGTAQRTAALSTVFGARAVTGVNILLAEGTDQLKAFREELIGSAGASQDMANIIRSSLQNRLAALRSAAIETGFKFLQAFEKDGAGAIELLTQKIREFDVTPIVEGVGKAIEFIKQWGPVVLDLAPTILKIAVGIKAWSVAQGLLNLAMAASPIGLIAAAAAALLLTMNELEKKFGFGAAIVEEAGGGIGSREFEENRRRRFAESELGQKLEAQREAAFADPRLSGTINGQINITGLPAGSTAEMDNTGAARDIDFRLLGPN